MNYEVFLAGVVDQIFDHATYRYDLNWPELAARAGVAGSTVYRLGMRQTRLPLLRTVYKLADAVGMNVRLIKRQLPVRRAA